MWFRHDKGKLGLTVAELELAIEVLVPLVVDEYPTNDLPRIAETYATAPTRGQIAALAAVQKALPPTRPR